MPDIQTAFQLALSKTQTHIPTTIPKEWDDETSNAAIEVTTTQGDATMHKAYFSVTNNVTRATFEQVKTHPGKTRVQIVKMLEECGFLAASTTSILSQMIRQDLVREVQNLLYVQAAEYRPLKTAKAFKAGKEHKVPKIVPVAEVKAEPAPQINSTWDVTDQLNSMSIVQARLMYDALRKIFGG